jgi:hypothetical protein
MGDEDIMYIYIYAYMYPLRKPSPINKGGSRLSQVGELDIQPTIPWGLSPRDLTDINMGKQKQMEIQLKEPEHITHMVFTMFYQITWTNYRHQHSLPFPETIGRS